MNVRYVITLLIIVIFAAVKLVFPQERVITLHIVTNNLPDNLPDGQANSTVYITGNNLDLGEWNRMVPMEKITGNLWQLELKAETGDTLQFKFTRGSWINEAVDSNGIEFPNFVHVVYNDTTLKYEIPTWRDLVHQNIVITTERLKNKSGWFELFEGWQYKIGDDTAWADPHFDDSNWERINPLLNKEDFEKLDWTGNIWFRNHIFVDSSLWNIPFGLQFINTGAAEIYLNGNLLYKYGVVGNSKETEEVLIDRTPRHIVFEGREEQVIAVRYSNHSAEEMITYNVPVGFTAIIGDLDSFIYDRIMTVRELSVHQLGFSAFILAFAIMHLLLFIFYPKAKENLFYSISMLSFAVVIYTGTQNNFVNSILTALDVSTINSISVQMSILFGLLTVYASSYTRMPKQYILFVTVSALFVFQTIFFPYFGGQIIDYCYYIFSIILALEIFRVVVRSMIRKEQWGWGWIIGVGFIVAMILIAYQILILTEVIVKPLFGINLVYVYGIVFLAITVSINLAKKISDTNKDLGKQLIQVKELSEKALEQERKAKEEEVVRRLLEADNKRKTKELEEARKLQLSMLPKNVPDIPGLDIAVYMKPATEVGGDYYDFKYDHNESLTIAVGDATGHGMRAGTLVAAIKGLFTAEPVQTDILSFFNKCNTIIRDMQLGNLYMAMMMAKINGNKMVLSSAGMPPALVYRYNTKQVEEIRIQGMPLGGSADFEYVKKETSLSMGDTLLLMSDGFPELFNNKKEILDYDKAKEIFGSVASHSPRKIIDELCKAADKWKDETDQQDDITFVVVKKK